MQRSTPLTRKTGPASCVRNFDGTVSRCLASSVCSKLPLKAKAHGVRREGVESIRGGGVGGAPPPRTGCSRGKVPHSAPLCNTTVVICPTDAGECPCADAFSLQTGEFLRGTTGPSPAQIAQDGVQAAHLHGELQSARRARTLRRRCRAPA